MKRFLSTFLLSALLIISSFAQSNTVVRVTEPDAIRPAEVSVAINPANPNNIVATSFQYVKVGGASS